MHSLGREGGGQAGQHGGGDVGVDEELLGGVAHAGALGLGVDQYPLGHYGIGGLVDVDEADAGVVLDDRDGGVLRDEADERFAAAGDDAVDELVELEEVVERGAVGGGDELDGVGGQAGLGEGALDERGEGGVGVEDLLAAAEDGGVAALQAEDGAVDGDVGACLVDDADDADGHADLADFEAVGAGPGVEGLADGVGQGGDLEDGLGEVGELGGGEGEALDLGLGELVGLGGGEVLGVGGEEFGLGGGEEAGEGAQGGVLLRGGRGGEDERGGAGAAGDAGDELGEVF